MKPLTLKELEEIAEWLYEKCKGNHEDMRKFSRIQDIFLNRANVTGSMTVNGLMGLFTGNRIEGSKPIKLRTRDKTYDLVFVTEETCDGASVVVLNAEDA